MSILAAIFRVRVTVLSLLSVGAVAAGVAAFHGHAVPVAAVFLTAMSLAAGGTVSYLHLRHAALAALVVMAPLPGLLAASWTTAGSPLSGVIAGYGLGFLVAALSAGAVVRSLLDGADTLEAARRCLAELALPTAAGALSAAFVETAWLFHAALSQGLGAALAAAAAMVSSYLFVVFGASVLPYGESFFTAANRVRERREDWLGRAGVVAEPRWAISLTGIALVLGVLGWFGAGPAFAHKAELVRHTVWAASAGFVLLAALAVGRDWRAALASTLGLAMLTLVSLWLWRWTVGHIVPATLLEIALVDAAALTVTFVILDRARRFRKQGDAAPVARQRAWESLGAASWLAPAGAAAAIVPWTVVHGSLATLAILFLLAGAMAALIAPAIATALETLLPRRRSVRELYGRG